MKQSILLLAVLLVGCGQKPESEVTPPPAKAESNALDLYDVSLNTDTITVGQQISYCFKARNAVSVSGFPGKFQRNGALDGDCLVHGPEVDTMYRLELFGADGRKRVRTAFVKVRKPNR